VLSKDYQLYDFIKKYFLMSFIERKKNINEERNFFFFLGNKNPTTQPTPFYVRRQSSVDTHMQPFLTQMVAPRVPPLLEDKNEPDAL
jgi:hypothetical protein